MNVHPMNQPRMMTVNVCSAQLEQLRNSGRAKKGLVHCAGTKCLHVVYGSGSNIVRLSRVGIVTDWKNSVSDSVQITELSTRVKMCRMNNTEGDSLI